jgi:hypothetical protein
MSKEQQILEHIRLYADNWRMDGTKSEENYQWLMDYADKQSDNSIKTTEYLDSKADAMMRYIGLLITLSVTVLGYAMTKDGSQRDALFFFPVLVALLYSLWNLLQCTRPTDQPRQPFISDAFEYSQNPENNKLYFMRNLMDLEYRLWLLNFKKGTLIEFSLRGFFLAIAWLLIGIGALIYKTEITYYLSFPSEFLVLGLGLVAVGLLALRQYRRPVVLEEWEDSLVTKAAD